jgi:hypothetical protein
MVERHCVIRYGVILIAMLGFLACSRRAPGPAECVRFAEMTFGHDFRSLMPYRTEKAAFDRLVEICLTSPFDRGVFTCTDESHAPMACLRRVQPELDRRVEAVLDAVLRRDWQYEVF